MWLQALGRALQSSSSHPYSTLLLITAAVFEMTVVLTMAFGRSHGIDRLWTGLEDFDELVTKY